MNLSIVYITVDLAGRRRENKIICDIWASQLWKATHSPSFLRAHKTPTAMSIQPAGCWLAMIVAPAPMSATETPFGGVSVVIFQSAFLSGRRVFSRRKYKMAADEDYMLY
ncbi:hypothetical protein SAMN05421858_3472 [Haladaptatus litoreus]|uniref:Uncharacterized protein n=1 Tax=Haladaptatus litoreus TaxID=553468 RepID=A0A1N7DB31_9EURY|nr:hypothetical protein SAMN05421858_3472 [Haladaptatus litoreus]